MSIDVMKQALEAIELSHPRFGVATEIYMNAIANLRAAIEHAERPQTHSDGCWRWHHQCAVERIKRAQAQEPVAYMRHLSAVNQGWDELSLTRAFDDDTPLYTAPRQWQGLTDEESDALWRDQSPYYHYQDFAEAIEAKLREKNS